MIVNSVTVNNIDKLTYIYEQGKTNENFKKSFSSKITSLLNHIRVDFTISDIGILEYYFMKKISSDISIPLYTDLHISSNSFVDKTKYPERFSIVEKFRILENEMIKDDDIKSINKITDIPFLDPIGAIRIDNVLVTFRGENLLLFSNGFIEKFIESISEKSEEEVQNFFVKELIQSFYSFMGNHLSNVDILSEYSIQSYYYKYIGLSDKLRLAELSCPAGIMSFFGDASDHILDDVKKIKDFISKNEKEKYRVRYSFIFNTDIYTFFILDQLCPWIDDHQPFKILLGQKTDAIPPLLTLHKDIRNKYNKRLEEVYRNYTSIKNVVVQSPEDNLNRYNYILSNQKLKYSVSFTLSDFLQLVSIADNGFVSLWTKSGNINIVDSRISEIFKTIFQLIKNVNSFIY